MWGIVGAFNYWQIINKLRKLNCLFNYVLYYDVYCIKYKCREHFLWEIKLSLALADMMFYGN